MTTKTRPEVVDRHGTRHRHGCDTPEPTTTPATIRGWSFHTCPTCGATRLERTTA